METYVTVVYETVEQAQQYVCLSVLYVCLSILCVCMSILCVSLSVSVMRTNFFGPVKSPRFYTEMPMDDTDSVSMDFRITQTPFLAR